MNKFVLSKLIIIACLIGGAAFDAHIWTSGPLLDFLEYYPGITRLEKLFHYYFSLLAFAEFRHHRRYHQ